MGTPRISRKGDLRNGDVDLEKEGRYDPPLYVIISMLSINTSFILVTRFMNSAEF